MFAVTNIDDIVVLAVLFGRAARRRPEVLRVIAGHYFGFVGILAVSALGALGASLLPERAIAYLGILPLLLGVRAAWQAWRPGDDGPDDGRDNAVGILGVAAVTFANGGGTTSASTSRCSPSPVSAACSGPSRSSWSAWHSGASPVLLSPAIRQSPRCCRGGGATSSCRWYSSPSACRFSSRAAFFSPRGSPRHPPIVVDQDQSPPARCARRSKFIASMP